MRFAIKIVLNDSKLPLDYRRIVLSLFKDSLEEYNEDWYKNIYIASFAKTKPFTFSAYLPGAKFTENSIELSGKEIIINFSTSNEKYGIYFYNALLNAKGNPYKYKNNITLKIVNISLQKETVIKGNCIIFKTLSPIIVRNHNRESNVDEYLKFDSNAFIEELKMKIFFSTINEFKFNTLKDVNKLDIKFRNMKNIPILHYADKIKIRPNGTIGEIKIKGKEYLLNFISKAGIGSRRNQGFGMVKII